MRLIDIDDPRNCYVGSDGDYERYNIDPDVLEEALPSVEPKRKKGKWIEDRLVSTGGGTYGVRRCSECEAYYQDVGYGWYYCPNCGARMENSNDRN